MKRYYLEEVQEVLRSLETDMNGIDPEQAALRLENRGMTKLAEARKKTVFERLIDQLKDPMVIILIAAAVISGIVREFADAVVILAVVILNSVLGVVQEERPKGHRSPGEAVLAFLEGQKERPIMQIKSEELVPGDIVLLEAGDAVPADMRLIGHPA